MARRFNSEIPVVQYRGVTIRLYRRQDGWKSTFQLHGHKRRECYRSTEAAAQQAAQNAIGDELEPNAVAANKDEVTARALLAPHGVSLIESARYWLSEHEKPLIDATAAQVRNIFPRYGRKTRATTTPRLFVHAPSISKTPSKTGIFPRLFFTRDCCRKGECSNHWTCRLGCV